MTIPIAVRLPEELVSRLDELVPSAHGSRSQAIRRAIEVYLAGVANERDAAVYDRLPLGDEELTLADDPGGWAGTPAW